MARLADKTLMQVLDDFASSAPTPGGGSAAALTGALGASLLAMVAALPKTKTGAPEERTALDDARAKLLVARDQLVDLIDRDAASYEAVVAAYRLPKGTDDEKAARKAAVQDALKLATSVPLETVRACSDALESALTVAAIGNPSAASDLAVGVNTLMMGIQGAWLNIGTNVTSITDTAFVQSVATELRTLLKQRAKGIAEIFQSGGILDLMRQTMQRIGPMHGHPE